MKMDEKTIRETLLKGERVTLEQWKYDDPRCIQARAFCKAHLDSAVYREKNQGPFRRDHRQHRHHAYSSV